MSINAISMAQMPCSAGMRIGILKMDMAGDEVVNKSRVW